MGAGIAYNLLRAGHRLTLLDHPGNQPLDELIGLGATLASTPAALAAEVECVLLCVPGSPEVETVLTGPQGVMSAMKPGAVIIDCSTSVPESTLRLAEQVRAAGGRFVDAPMTRTPTHARAGTLNLLVGAAPEDLEAVRPVLAAFSESIAHVGPVGAGHRMKLIHNFVSLGSVALIAEAAALAVDAGIDGECLIEVLQRGGGWGAALDRLAPYLRERDVSGLRFAMAHAEKDLGYYCDMATEAGAAQAIAGAVHDTYRTGRARGGDRAWVPTLVDQLRRS